MPQIEKNISLFAPEVNLNDPNDIKFNISLDAFNLKVAVVKDTQLWGVEVYSSQAERPYFGMGAGLESIELFKKKWEAMQIFIHPKIETLLPAESFNENALEEYLKFNYGNTHGCKYFVDDIPEISAKQVYALPAELCHKIEQLLPSAKVSNANASLISFFSQLQEEEMSVFLNVRHKNFDFFAFRENKLVLSNTFPYNTAQDFIYYLMFAITQIAFNPEKLSLVLCGDIDKEGSLYNYIYKYIWHVTFLKNNKLVQTDKLEGIQYHQYFNILY